MRKSNFDFKTRSHKVLPPHKRKPSVQPPPPPKPRPSYIHPGSALEGLNMLVSHMANAESDVELRSWPEAELKKQISAPSYLQSLAQNEMPPFKTPGKEPRPSILVGMNTLVSEADIVEIIGAHEEAPHHYHGMNKAIKNILFRSNLVHGYDDADEIKFLVLLLKETISYSAQRDFTSLKLSVLFTIYLTTHKYLKWYYWTPPIAIWRFFKELMIRHTVEDAPDCVEIFDPEECYDILSHFHTMYFTNLPLVHILTFRMHRLSLTWPFALKGKAAT